MAVGRDWVADVVSLLIGIEEGDCPRPVAVLVVADHVVLHHDMLGRLSGEPEVVAGALEAGIRRSAKLVGRYPARVCVRHDQVARALGKALAREGVKVVADASPPGLEAVARGLVDALGGHQCWPPLGRSETWRGWDLPGELIGDIFAAAARFYEAAPWDVMSNFQAPRVTLPSGRQWTACVLGRGGDEFGLALYSESSDLFELLAERSGEEGFEGLRGCMVSITYDRLAKQSSRARAELRLSRWKLAGPAAYPALMTCNQPGGGVTSEDARDLILLLDATPAFADAQRDLLTDEDLEGVPCHPIEWTDPRSGVVFRYQGEATRVDDAQSSLGGEIRQEIGDVIRAVTAEVGADATPDEFMSLLNARLRTRMDERNTVPSHELGGLAPAQVHLLLSSDWGPGRGLVLSRDLAPTEVEAVAPVRLTKVLLELAAERGGLGRTQAGNLMVAVVRELTVRAGLGEDDALVACGKRITEQDMWPLHQARIWAELAGLLGTKKTRFVLTRKGRTMLAPDRASELYALLFETVFRRYNLFYGGYTEWPELQHQMAFTLLRLSQVAGGWRLVGDLVDDVVLPYAMEHAPHSRWFDQAWLLDNYVLEHLVAFGLVERRGEDTDVRECRLTPRFHRLLAFDL